MKLRSILFWAHLSCGIAAGLVILMMSVTGVLLTYERQILNWADRQSLPAITARGERANLAEIIAAARAHAPGAEPSGVTVLPDENAAVAVSMGRGHTVYVDPFTARVLGEGAQGFHGFFSWVTQMHRWFAVGDESHATARAITGASNLVFLFIVLSGMYLWLPQIWRKTQFRKRLWFTRSPKSARARDFNWHHVLGIWMCLPLAIIIASATVFSYGWANALVYKAFGEEVPQRGGPPGRGPGAPSTAANSTLDYDAMLAKAAREAGEWNSLTLRLPVSTEVSITLDRGTGGQPQKQSTLVLDAASVRLIRTETFDDQTPARQARSIIRRLHTGEVLGVAGQTLAGIASLAAVLLVWTGLALAWRRLVQPLFVKRRRIQSA
jgi:uncharacterized iron-regulated membrane protein